MAFRIQWHLQADTQGMEPRITQLYPELSPYVRTDLLRFQHTTGAIEVYRFTYMKFVFSYRYVYTIYLSFLIYIFLCQHSRGL